MSRLGVFVQVDVIPGQLEKLRASVQEFFDLTRQEQGLEYRQVMVDDSDLSKVFIFEFWQSRQDYENHITTAHCRKFAENIQGTYGPCGVIRTLTPFS